MPHVTNKRSKRTEEILRESEARFRSVVEAMPAALVMVNQNGEIALINARVEEWFGYDRDDLIGQSVELLVPESLRDQHLTDRRRYLREPEARQMGKGRDLYARRKDGSTFPVEIGLMPIMMEGDVHILSTIVDITERKRIEEARRRLAAIVESSNDAIIGKTLDGRITSWNTGAEQLYGYTEDEVLGRPISLIAPPDRPEDIPRIMETLRRGERVQNYETVRQRKDGSRIPISLTVSPIKNDDGTVVGASAIARDITERVDAERKVRQLNEELEQRVRERTTQLEATNKELEAFSYSVSHDLRAPLRSIDGFSRILLKSYADDVPPKAQHYLQRIRHNTAMMAELVDDLLQFSRLSRQAMERQPVKPKRVVREVLEELAEWQEDREVEIEVDDLPVCEADPRLLKQVYVNLLTNALKYTQPREVARIRVGARQNDAGPVYFVADNGVGFDMTYADKLFGVFQRLHRAEDFEGTGVGLAIVQRIVHRHGGEVWAEAESDAGATFYFTLTPTVSHGR